MKSLRNRSAIVVVALALLLSACASPVQLPAGQDSASESGARAAPTRIVAAVMGEPNSLNSTASRARGGVVPGVNVVEGLVHAGLVQTDNLGKVHPQLAEAVPSLENGLWKLFPDGQMETTWKIRSGARWHDETPFTSMDLQFTAQLAQDRELAVFRHIAFDSIASVDAPDPDVVTVKWNRAFIEADTLFSSTTLFPLPRHVLENPYSDDKSSVTQLAYWGEGFVGTGPYKLREWQAGSHLMLEANDAYVLGRPWVQEVLVKFIPDPNTLMANVLAGTVEMTLGRALSLDQALEVRDQWRDGKVEISIVGWDGIYVQFLDPNPRLVAEPQFRRAVLHAIDRTAMADTLQAGLVPVAHIFISPEDPAYRNVEPAIVPYDYDPRRSIQLIEGLGYVKGSDDLFRDATGQKLSVETRATGRDELSPKELFAVADYWKRVGIDVEPVVVPRQSDGNREYQATYPALYLLRQPNQLNWLRRVHGSQTPVPENSYAGENRSRYRNPEFDALIDRYFTTVPVPERMEALAQVVRHMTDQLNVLSLFYYTVPIALAGRVKNVAIPRVGDAASQAWNGHLWEAGP